MLNRSNIQIDNIDPSTTEVEHDHRERMILKAQRNYLLKLYEVTMSDINIYDSIQHSFHERWRDLNNRPQPLNHIERYELKVIEAEAYLYENSLKRIRDKIQEWNIELSQKIIEFNIKLGYEEFDLYDRGEPYEDDDSEDSDYDIEETPMHDTQIDDESSGDEASDSDDQ